MRGRSPRVPLRCLLAVTVGALSLVAAGCAGGGAAFSEACANVLNAFNELKTAKAGAANATAAWHDAFIRIYNSFAQDPSAAEVRQLRDEWDLAAAEMERAVAESADALAAYDGAAARCSPEDVPPDCTDAFARIDQLLDLYAKAEAVQSKQIANVNRAEKVLERVASSGRVRPADLSALGQTEKRDARLVGDYETAVGNVNAADEEYVAAVGACSAALG